MSDPQDIIHNEAGMEDHSDFGDETANGVDSGMMEGDGNEGEAHSGRNVWKYIEPDSPTDYSLFNNPPNLGVMRQRMFDMEDPIQFSPPDFLAYFHFVDNVWRRNHQGTAAADGSRTDVYHCRMRKNSSYKSNLAKAVPDSLRQRRKTTREELNCGMSMRVIYTGGAIPTCTMVTGEAREVKHSHDLNYMDEVKRNTGIMNIARNEGLRGFLASSTYNKMCLEPQKMQDAGGAHLKVSDCRNVQIPWREANKDVPFKIHSGYTQGRKPRVSTTKAPTKPVPRQQQSVVQPMQIPSDTLQYPDVARVFLEDYLPTNKVHRSRPHVTLTYASSLDGRISLMPGVQTAISGPETKAMTHYLRSRHDAILIGVRTAIADDPSLNCRLVGSGGFGGQGLYQQPRPIIIDPHARLHIHHELRLLQMVRKGRAYGPWIVVSPTAQLHSQAVSTLKAHGGEYLMINDYLPHSQGPGMDWSGIFSVLFKEGIRSIMIEGGGVVLSELLKPQYAHLLDSLVVTIAPTFMGKAGTVVSPDTAGDERGKPIAGRVTDVKWQPMGEEDVVMCGKFKAEDPAADGMLQGIEHFSRTSQPGSNGFPPSAGGEKDVKSPPQPLSQSQPPPPP